jgi:transketolase
MADLPGISYMRTTRAALPTIYGPDEAFEVGGSKVLLESGSDQVAVIAAGYTLHEALKAADTLAAEGISARVIDLYSVKPLDLETLTAASTATGGRLVTVEDHWPEGGLGSAVVDAFADTDARPRVVKLAVTHLPGSGTPDQLVNESGIGAAEIAQAARELVARGPQLGVGAGVA